MEPRGGREELSTLRAGVSTLLHVVTPVSPLTVRQVTPSEFGCWSFTWVCGDSLTISTCTPSEAEKGPANYGPLWLATPSTPAYPSAVSCSSTETYIFILVHQPGPGSDLVESSSPFILPPSDDEWRCRPFDRPKQ